MKYEFNTEKVPRGYALLDRNHSHFILVKNLKNCQIEKETGKAPFGGEIELRNRLEQKLRDYSSKQRREFNVYYFLKFKF